MNYILTLYSEFCHICHSNLKMQLWERPQGRVLKVALFCHLFWINFGLRCVCARMWDGSCHNQHGSAIGIHTYVSSFFSLHLTPLSCHRALALSSLCRNNRLRLAVLLMFQLYSLIKAFFFFFKVNNLEFLERIQFKKIATHEFPIQIWILLTILGCVCVHMNTHIYPWNL